MARHVYGIDFGTGNIKMFNGVTKRLLNEKNIIAIKNEKEVFSFGNEAFEMYEKAPDEIVVTYPIKYGVIADMKNMESLFENFFAKINAPKKRKQGDFYIAIPTDISEVEKRAFYDLVADSKIKVKDIAVVDKPIADAIGIGIDISSSQGSMIVNIGADTTEITVTSLGGIVVSKIIKMGGNKLDETICNIIKKKYNILIGMKTAEIVKITLANAIVPEEDDDDDEQIHQDNIRVYGRNIITGLPANKVVSSDLVSEAIHETLYSLVDSIKILLERTPPELSADIITTGVYLTGGSSAIPNLDVLIADATGLKVNTVPEPELTVINGLAEIITNPKLNNLLYTPRDK